MSTLATLRGLLPATLRAPTVPAAATRLFTTTTTLQKKKKGKSANEPKSEDRTKLKGLKASLFAPPPPPLRMARSRHLRHWTIHRAWLLHQRKVRDDKQRELMRMQQGMSDACEELRKTSGPGLRDEGYLYRVAMEKKGVYGPRGIPIEYSRLQTDTPAREAWNHEWVR